MGHRTVALVGTLDTKAADYDFLRSEIERRGFQTLTIDVGVRGASPSPADIHPEQVAEAGGANLGALARAGNRGDALSAMARGAARLCGELYLQGKLGGVVAMGGGGGTMVGCSAMRALPLGVPKLMVSTLASGDTAKYVDISDIVMMPAVVDISGLNRISRGVYRRAAAAICGMMDAEQSQSSTVAPAEERPAIAVSMFGNTMRAVSRARSRLEAAGYEVVTFHATGAGGRTMETLIAEGHFVGVLDITTTEVADHVCGGVLSAGPGRLSSAGALGIPQVVAPGCIDMCNFHGLDTMPEKYAERLHYQWDSSVTLMRTNPAENREIARIMARHLNEAIGQVEVYIPLCGYSELDVEGGPFWSPEADRAFVDSIKTQLKTGIPVHTVRCAVNDALFAESVADALVRLIKPRRTAQQQAAQGAH